MNPKLRLLLYVLLLGCMAAFATGFYAVYHAPPAPAIPARSTNTVAVTNPVVSTNPAAATNAVALTNQAIVTPAEPDEDLTLRRSSGKVGRLTAYAIGMFFTLIGLALLISQDISR